MFALGRFVANSGDRSDQANQIDFGVAMTLTQQSLDGSPLVRKVSPVVYFLATKLLYENPVDLSWRESLGNWF